MYGPNIIDLGYGALVAGTPPNTLLSLRIMGQKMKPVWITEPKMLQDASEFQIQTPTKWEQQITLYPGISSTNLNGAGATVTSWANNATNQPNLIFLNIWSALRSILDFDLWYVLDSGCHSREVA